MNPDNKSAPKSKWIDWLKVAGIYIALLLLVELSGQVFIRYLESKRPSGIEAENLVSYQEPVLGFALKKNLNEKLSDWSVKTDRWGFRSISPLQRAKENGEKRIFVFGGSTVFGWGVDEPYTITHLLQEKVDAHLAQLKGNTTVRVINAGVPWYASWHEAAMFYFRASEFAPDAAVFLDGLNDTALGIGTTWTPLYEGYVDRPTQLSYERKKQGEKGTFLFDTLSLSPTFRYFYARYHEREGVKTGFYRPEVWDQYLSIMERVKRLADSEKVLTQWFFQPVQCVDKPISHYELTHNGTSMANPKFEATFRKQYLEGERRVLSSKLPVISLKSLFKDEKETIYLDGLHYYPLGNRAIAAKLFETTVKRWVENWVGESNRLTLLQNDSHLGSPAR